MVQRRETNGPKRTNSNFNKIPKQMPELSQSDSLSNRNTPPEMTFVTCQTATLAALHETTTRLRIEFTAGTHPSCTLRGLVPFFKHFDQIRAVGFVNLPHMDVRTWLKDLLSCNIF